MEREGRQIFSKILCASKLTRQRTLFFRLTTLTLIVVAVDSIGRSDKKKFLIHGELRETNKALLFFSELGSNSFKPLILKLTKIDTKRLKLSFAMFEDTVKI